MSTVHATAAAGGLVGEAANERAFRRVGIDAFVRTIDADREFAFRTRDVSEGDLFLCTRVGHLYPFRAGDELALELHYDGRVIAVHGTVTRVVAAGSPETTLYPEGFGVLLAPLDVEQKAALRALIESAAPSTDSASDRTSRSARPTSR